jgi:hypothetical protein
MRDNLYSALDLKLDPRKLVCYLANESHRDLCDQWNDFVFNSIFINVVGNYGTETLGHCV